jgi:hypothetical protein
MMVGCPRQCGRSGNFVLLAAHLEWADGWFDRGDNPAGPDIISSTKRIMREGWPGKRRAAQRSCAEASRAHRANETAAA